jgi:hypothetical protein
LAARYGGEAAPVSSLVVAVPTEPHAAIGTEAATPALAPAVPAEARPVEAGPTLDGRQRRMLLLMMMNSAAQQPRFGTLGRLRRPTRP